MHREIDQNAPWFSARNGKLLLWRLKMMPDGKGTFLTGLTYECGVFAELAVAGRRGGCQHKLLREDHLKRHHCYSGEELLDIFTCGKCGIYIP